MLARLKRFSFISIPNDRQFVKRVSEKKSDGFSDFAGNLQLAGRKNVFSRNLGGRAAWGRLHTPSACSFLVLRRSLSLLPQTFREEPKNPPESCVIQGDNAYRSPLRPRLRLTRRTGCPALFFALDAFVRATGLFAGALSTRMGVPPRRILPSLPMTTG